MCLQFGLAIYWHTEIGAKAAHKMLVKLPEGVNFINVLRTNFSYERRFSSLHVTRKNDVRTKKRACITLVKLPADVGVEKVVCCTSCEKTRQEKRQLLSSNGVFENSDDFDDHPRTSFSNFDDNLSDDDDEDSLSLLELQRDLTPFQLSDRNVDKSTNGNSTSTWKPPHPPASDTLSTLSSVSSMTLQAGTKANGI